MTSSPPSRDALRDLVELRGDLATIVARVVGHSIPDGPAVTLTSADIRRALELHASGVLSDDSLEQWAEVIHGVDEIEIDESERGLLTRALFELSTPELFGGMSSVVDGVRRRLR